MRAVVQRVSDATVRVDSQVCGSIGHGLLVLIAVEDGDEAADGEWLSGKLTRLRIFDDEQGVMNRSVKDVDGGILLVSQFTLMASTRKGNRPSYIRSAPPPIAAQVFERFIHQVESDLGKPVQRGRFGARMAVTLTNDGPVTILLDSRLRE